MKISAQRAKELGRGGALKTSQGNRYIPRTPRPEFPGVEDVNTPTIAPVVPKEDPFIKDSLSSILTILAVSEGNIAGIVKNNQVMAEVIAEMAKPKPKKKWAAAVVSRDRDGKLLSLSIEEK